MISDDIVKFLPFDSVVDSSFWYKLCQVKLEIDKLDENHKQIWGFYMFSNSNSVHIDCSSFNTEHENKLNSSKFLMINHLCSNEVNFNSSLLKIRGTLINLNSLDSFKTCDKHKLLECYGNRIISNIKNNESVENPEYLNEFVLLTFADLKSYEFFYWFAFPAPSNLEISILKDPMDLEESYSAEEIEGLLVSHSELQANQQVAFGILTSHPLLCISLKEFINKFSAGEEVMLGFLDPSINKSFPGWPLRNLLNLVAYYCSGISELKILCLRLGRNFKKSKIIFVKLGEFQENKWIGWEKNERGKFGPRFVNLRADMDPVQLAETSANLNLKLMKWRLEPELDLEIIQGQKCLLLGAGTLGCSVARSLMAWGVKHITFVDSGNVSFSNPVRQSLYTFDDCDSGSGLKSKATSAASAIKKILPSVESTGIVMEIPMPGHPTGDLNSAARLYDLIESHDIIFLLTDSRESRWLPALISASLKKLAITAALGYDTYLVIRHGLENSSGSRLGCYFCNDVTAPGNSKIDRTLDQQCTVTRPGVSTIAASLAVELMVSILQHPERGRVNPNEESLLGVLPHSIRGFLHSFSQIMPSTPSFPQCIACSSKVVNEFNLKRDTFLKNVFESTSYLEDLTGLTDLHKAAESLEVLDLTSEEDEEEED